jgi:PAS domain S-box-containing protein
MTETKDPIATPTPGNFLVVGLGGSAGAITSFREFFRNVPANSGMAYVVILHLSPDHESRLAEVLQAVANVPVVQVRDQMRVEPDHVYVIPPNKSLAMDDGHLMLSDVTSFEERRAPVDIFFRTLADRHDSRAVCVIMSGSGTDGSMGLRRVKEYNGLVLVQDPAEAAFAEMPRSCIATGLVDLVVPASEMPRRIAEYRRQLGTVQIPIETEARAGDDERALMEIFTLLRLRTGHDFANYKRATVLRRIERRMAVRDLQRLPEYVALLRERNEEAYSLLRELLISVTNFFRDPEVWEKFERNFLPKLIAAKRPDDPLRVWVPGCATGEEAYTVAMLLAERVAPGVQIFATDLDERAIARARNAWYSDTEVADVPPERLRRFFVKEQDGYRVRREVREMVLFAHHNLIKDPPFSHLDFVSCRNLLIYLNRSAQQRAMETLHFALAPDGYLLLGTAESVDASANLFSIEDKEAHIYRARAVERTVPVRQPLPHATAVIDVVPLLENGRQAAEARPRERIAPLDLHHRLLEQYAAPSIVVDDQYNIVHLTDRAGSYLQFSAGEASTNLLQVVRQELRIDLRSALFQAGQKRMPVAARGLKVHGAGDGRETIDIVVRPVLSEEEPVRGFFLIVFEPAGSRHEPVREATPLEPAARQLEEELLRTKTQMRTTIEQYEVQVEEAKAANEELQAMNEELRSTAEELETSQEELHSVNEELQTVNQELKIKIDEITHAGDDLRNLISSTDIGTIFLDRALRVKLFTPRARDLFNLISTDVGRRLLDITHNLAIDDLAANIERVIDRLQPVEREVASRDGAWFLMRLAPYRTSEDRIDGVVMTFLEITERHRAEIALRESEARYRTLFESIDQGFCTVEVLFDGDKAVDYRFLEVNPAFEQQTGIVNPVGRRMREIAPDHEEHWFETYGRVATTGESARLEQEAAQLGRWFDVYAFRAGDPDLRRVGLLFNDVTEARRVRETLRRAAALDSFRVRLNDAIGSLTEPAAIRNAAMSVVGDALHVDRVLCVEVTPDGEAFLVEDNYVRGDFPPLVGRFPRADFPAGAAVLARGDTLRIDDVERDEALDPVEKEAFVRLAIKSALAVPVIRNGRWLLNVCVHHGGPRTWSDDDVAILRETAERTWAAVERAGAQIALREAEERYRTLFVSMDEGYAVVDVLRGDDGAWSDFRFIEVNPAFEKQTGMRNVVGRTATEVLGTPNPRWAQIYGHVAETGEAVRFEEGEPVVGRIFDLYTFRIGGPGPQRVAVLFTDITSRKEQEAALRHSEARLQTITNLVPDLLWSDDRSGRTDWYNERWLEYTGYRLEQAADGWLDAVHPDDRAASRARFQDAVDRGEPLRHESRIRGASGEYRWFLVTAVPLRDDEGNVTRYFGAATDVHEQRMAREHLEHLVSARTGELGETTAMLQSIVHASPVAIVSTDRDHNVRAWNPAAETMFGWSASEVVGRPLPILPPELESYGQELFRSLFEEGVIPPPHDSVRVRRDGTRMEVTVLVAPLRDAEGRIYASMAMLQDITARKLMERERAGLLRRLVESQEEQRERIARELHDEMGQHITALRVGLDSSQTDRLDELKSIITRIDDSIDRLTLELRPPALDQLGLHGAIMTLADEFSAASGIRMVLHVGIDDGDRFGDGVETTLYRVLQESLTNVWKHAAAETVSVIVEREPDALRMIVEDDGRGFDPAAVAAEAAPRGRVGLLGIRERVTLAGGTFDIESEPGHGATIFVRIPLPVAEARA